MQVMEAAARPQPSQPLNEELVGLQFGLATANEFRSKGSKCSQIFLDLLNSKQQQGHSIWITNSEKDNKIQYCFGNNARIGIPARGVRARIVHQDIKASNSRLDRNFNPKIADFGMTRLFEDHQSHVSTRVARTLGCVAPEYALFGYLTEKGDVFSYGIMLLELASGRFNIRLDMMGEQAYLLEWIVAKKDMKSCV